MRGNRAGGKAVHSDGETLREGQVWGNLFVFILHSSKFQSLRSPSWYAILAVNIHIVIGVLLFSLSSTFQASTESSNVIS